VDDVNVDCTVVIASVLVVTNHNKPSTFGEKRLFVVFSVGSIVVILVFGIKINSDEIEHVEHCRR
jgi:hypothetical protein